MELLLCYNDEGVYVNTYSEVTKDVMMQWGELPASVAYIRSGQVTILYLLMYRVATCEIGYFSRADGIYFKIEFHKFHCNLIQLFAKFEKGSYYIFNYSGWWLQGFDTQVL